MFGFLFVLTISQMPWLTVASDELHWTSLLGSDVEFSCSSSYPPFWNKFGSAVGDFHIVGANGKRHPNWNEPRYFFVTTKSEYFLRISDLQLADAGKFICGSDSPKSFVLTVLR